MKLNFELKYDDEGKQHKWHLSDESGQYWAVADLAEIGKAVGGLIRTKIRTLNSLQMHVDPTCP